MTLFSDAEKVCQQIAVLPAYKNLVQVRKEHNAQTGHDNSKKLTKLFLEICKLVRSILMAQGGMIRNKYAHENGGAICAAMEFDEFEKHLHSAAAIHLSVWWEIKLFLDARGLSRGQQMREAQGVQVH